ncbi:zinc-binding dehydrogenase [Knoellia sinensis]|uniref:zinc-binding dehydrogenase n=1 Tax=Knoellia sinensis TaxID=136100 RepID=UPI003CCBAAC8
MSFGFSRDWETVPILEGLRADVLPALERGEIRPVIDSTVDIADFQKAADRLRPGDAVGKVVLTFADR